MSTGTGGSDEESVKDVVDKVSMSTGIDVLVNNAEYLPADR